MLVADDTALINTMNYLFLVILKYRFATFTKPAEVARRDSRQDWPGLVLVYAREDDAEALSLIEAMKSDSGSAVVIALQDDGSGFGAQAFLAGADDAVEWPCSLYELALRFMRRLGLPLRKNAELISTANWETEAYIADRAGLTTSEAQVMRVLFHQEGQIVSRDDLSMAVDGRLWRYGDRKFDVHVAKIRKKLSDAFGSSMSVSTIRSMGYCLSTNGAEVFGGRRSRPDGYR